MKIKDMIIILEKFNPEIEVYFSIKTVDGKAFEDHELPQEKDEKSGSRMNTEYHKYYKQREILNMENIQKCLRSHIEHVIMKNLTDYEFLSILDLTKRYYLNCFSYLHNELWYKENIND